MHRFFSLCGSSLENLEWYQPSYEELNEEEVDTDFTDYLHYCPKLKVIPDIFHISELIAAGQHCPDLTTVVIHNDPERSFLMGKHNDENIVAFFERCQKVEKFTVYYTNFSDTTITRMFQNCQHLRYLSLHAMRVSSKFLESLSANCSSEELVLHNIGVCESISNFSFPSLTRFLYNGFGHCGLSDNSLGRLIQSLSRLKQIELYCSPNITNTGLHHIATHCRNLEKLFLYDLSRVTEPECLIEILRNNPRLKRLGFLFKSMDAPLIVVSEIFTMRPWEAEEVEYTAELEALLNSRV